VGKQHFCEEHAYSFFAQHDFHQSVGIGEPAHTELARCFDIELIVISETSDQQAIYLREIGGRRFFSLLIGIFEATSLDRAIQGLQAPRPLTHDAMLDSIVALGGVLQDVMIADFEEHTYYADLRIRQNDQIVLVDMRPSDAVSLAVRANKPIFISDRVLEKMRL
jgi:bifunctional DNase/RNase